MPADPCSQSVANVNSPEMQSFQVPGLSESLSTPRVQKVVEPLLLSLSSLSSALTEQEQQQFFQRITQEASVNSMQEFLVKNERICTLKNDALKLFLSAQDSLSLLAAADVASVRAAFGMDSDHEKTVSQYWSMIRERKDGFLSYERVLQCVCLPGENLGQRIKETASLLLEEKRIVDQYKERLRFYDDIEKQMYDSLVKKKEQAFCQDERIEIEYSLLQVQLMVRPFINKKKVILIEKGISESEKIIADDRIATKALCLKAISDEQEKIRSLETNLRKILPSKLAALPKRDEGAEQVNPEIVCPGRSLIERALAFVSDPQAREGFDIKDCAEAEDWFIDEAMLLGMLQRTRKNMVEDLEWCDNLETSLIKSHGNPDELRELMPLQTEYDRAICTMGLEEDDEGYKEEDLTVQYFLNKLEQEAKHKIELFSQIANKVVDLEKVPS